MFDLDIHVLTEQYLLYLNKMEEMHLEVCSEYLVELATLIEYKSKKLLPKQEAELNDAYEEDPKDRLVRRLLEYQQFKEISEQLKQLYLDRQRQITKPISIESEEWIKANENQPVQGSP
ncbi:MAG: segregation and condensation protein A, partial [Holdemania filiformis]